MPYYKHEHRTEHRDPLLRRPLRHVQGSPRRVPRAEHHHRRTLRRSHERNGERSLRVRGPNVPRHGFGNRDRQEVRRALPKRCSLIVRVLMRRRKPRAKLGGVSHARRLVSVLKPRERGACFHGPQQQRSVIRCRLAGEPASQRVSVNVEKRRHFWTSHVC